MISKKLTYYDPKDSYALARFHSDFFEYLKKTRKKNQPLVLICIGSDRATGDCLGPLVGQSLIDSSFYSVYGTLQTPVHAQNLKNTMDLIYTLHHDPLIIAVDSCLGYKEHVGYITLSSLPLFPGGGVSKNLPGIGDLSITGIVDIFSDSNHETIQTTRLKTVFHLASFISSGIETPRFRASYLRL